ncbi:hypothetical protein DL89DRAFT_269487 [Linderina pennispora]|uniref:F-box domain-containing protein n=1 Tax=Linderina pennispora TaxID=61395 RepID=A0A1Y1W0L2_9FUNG|nr:uncharacterized protein DL89DRAFT_269487 [Linderina pennispora]ORX67049.1 hypothetical protein DL89DRAFT_269487 [Linderina pennispora]
MVRANSETVEELVLSRCTTEYLDEMAYDCDEDHHCIYPRLTKLTINDDYTSVDGVDGVESPASSHHFPSLSTLNIFTRWDSDFSFFVGNNRTMLTSLSFCLTESLLESLQGYVFPNLRRVCILESDYEISGIKAGAPIREFNLPFLIAPNAEQIECNIICNPRLITPNAIIPYRFSNPRLRHLAVDHFEPTLRELSRLLASLPQLTRLGILGIRGDLPAGTIYFDETIKTWLTILDLPALNMATELMSDCSLAQYAAEIKKPIYDKYRERLSGPLFCDNLNIRE